MGACTRLLPKSKCLEHFRTFSTRRSRTKAPAAKNKRIHTWSMNASQPISQSKFTVLPRIFYKTVPPANQACPRPRPPPPLPYDPRPGLPGPEVPRDDPFNVLELEEESDFGWRLVEVGSCFAVLHVTVNSLSSSYETIKKRSAPTGCHQKTQYNFSKHSPQSPGPAWTPRQKTGASSAP